MSISPAIITKPETRARYRLFHVICLDNIQRKFAQRQHMETDKIYCRNDPSPTYFRVSMDFGREAEALKVFLKPVGREVKVTLGRIELFDGCNRLESWEDDQPYVYELHGRNMEYTPEATSEATTWRLEIDLVYEGVTGVTSVTPVAPVASVTSVDQPKLRSQEEFGQLFDSGEDADYTFDVRGERIKAHKLVLKTRCKHFAAKFKSRMVDSNEEEEKVDDTKPEVFKQFLRFVYTDTAPKYDDTTMELLAVADYYSAEDLKMICEGEIISNLNASNVIDALILAEEYHCPTLMTSAKEVFGWYGKARLKLTEAWKKLIDHSDALQLLEYLV